MEVFRDFPVDLVVGSCCPSGEDPLVVSPNGDKVPPPLSNTGTGTRPTPLDVGPGDRPYSTELSPLLEPLTNLPLF